MNDKLFLLVQDKLFFFSQNNFDPGVVLTSSSMTFYINFTSSIFKIFIQPKITKNKECKCSSNNFLEIIDLWTEELTTEK